MPQWNRRLALFAASASALALSACMTVGPDFHRPAPPSGAAAAGYAMAGDQVAPGVQLTPDARTAGAWWLAFGSPELDEMVRLALAGSPTLAEANATLARARADAAAVRGEQLPQVDANTSVQRQRFNIQSIGFAGFANQTFNLYTVGGDVSYDLDIFGGRRRATEEARAKVETEARRADAAYLTLSGNVALQVMRIAGLRAQLAAVDSIVADDRRVLDLVRRAQRAGAEAPSAISSAEAQLAEDEALAPPLRRDLDAARHQLALLAGKSPAEWSPPDFDLARLTAPGVIPVTLPSDLVRRRPDILAAEADLHAATAAVGVATANQYPNLTLTGDLTQSGQDLAHLFDYRSSGWYVLGGVSAPIFHGGTLRARRRAAEAEAQAATARYQQTVLQAFVQVSDVLAALAADQQSVEALNRAAAASGRRARDAQLAYSLGGGTLLDVIDAQRTLSRTRRSLIQAEAQRYANLVQLFTATAADWRTAT